VLVASEAVSMVNGLQHVEVEAEETLESGVEK
jgi:hypothetical protein